MQHSKVGKGIKVISFFTGAGGLDLGFDLAEYDVVYATDIDGPFGKQMNFSVKPQALAEHNLNIKRG